MNEVDVSPIQDGDFPIKHSKRAHILDIIHIYIYIYIYMYIHINTSNTRNQTASLPKFKERYDATRSAATATGPATMPRRDEATTVGASKCRDMKAQWFGKKNDWMTMCIGLLVVWKAQWIGISPKWFGFGFPVTILASNMAMFSFSYVFKMYGNLPNPLKLTGNRVWTIGRNCRTPKKERNHRLV